MHFQETLQKNIRGIQITREKERAFSLLISVDVHSQNNDLKKEAIANVYTNALLSGCGTYTRDAFLDAVNLTGGSISVSIEDKILTMAVTCLDTNKKNLFALFTLMLQKPTFAPKEIARIKTLLSNEMLEAKEDAKMRSYNTFVNALYGTQDRHYATFGDKLVREIEKVTKADLVLFHKQSLGKNWIYTLASDPKLAKVTNTQLSELKLNFKEVETPKGNQMQKEVATNTVHTVSIPSKQNIELNVGAPLPFTLDSNEYYAFLFGLNVLGKWGGFAGRLMSTVREKEGLTYGIYAKTESISTSEKGYWRIMTFFAPLKVMEGLHSTLREIRLISEKGITKSEYERFKNILSTGQTLLQDSILKNVGQMHQYQLKGFTTAEIAEHKKKMFAVTQKEVNAALKKYLDVSKLVISAAGPVASKEKELKTLGKMVKVGL